MKRCIILAAMMLSGAPALAQEGGQPIAEQGFEPIFDGESFAGWRVREDTSQSWKIENGMLVLTGGRCHLFTEEQFDDFIFRFEWRPANKGYNSGLFVRGGNQIQMAQGGAGRLFGREGTKAVPQLQNPPGQWNQWEVFCVGRKLSLTVNGQPAWEIDDFKPVRGPLGIEAEGHYIEFRNLQIKRLAK
jgi:hypothetical protein